MRGADGERRGSGGWEKLLSSERELRSGEEWKSELYSVAQRQFSEAADALGLDRGLRTRLLEPRRSLTVNLPVRLDSGEIQLFTGYRVQHSLSVGPTKGGVRFAPGVSLGECAALALWMSEKCALLGLPFGGAKGGVRCDPYRLSQSEKERVTRRYTAEILPMIGADQDIPAPDLGTGPTEMSWMMDTYAQQIGHSVPAVVTGKPIHLGGIAGRECSTGLGVVLACEMGWRARLGRGGLDGVRVIVQGMGKVGMVAINELHKRGAIIVGVGDVSASGYSERGFDPDDLSKWITDNEFLRGYPRMSELDSRDSLLTEPTEILIPAALERQLTAENAPRVQAEMIVEAANGPTTPEADQIFADRGIEVIPDVFANAGGVVVSYFEWVQGLQRLKWSERQVVENLGEYMRTAWEQLSSTDAEYSLGLRVAAQIAALRVMAAAARDRGIYP